VSSGQVSKALEVLSGTKGLDPLNLGLDGAGFDGDLKIVDVFREIFEKVSLLAVVKTESK